MARFPSRYGGLWPDRSDALRRLPVLVEDGFLSAAEARRLRGWIARGWTVLRGAVPPALCARLARETDAAWRRGGPGLWATVHGHEGDRAVPVRPEFAGRTGVKLLDFYRLSRTAREALLAPALARWLSVLFGGERPLLFQSLSFLRGSEQPFHNDTMYVAVDSPMELAAAWVALEDWRPGCGELRFFEGSHRLPERLFGPEGDKAWSEARHGKRAEHAHLAALVAAARRRRLPLRRFRPRRGDVLIWHADLLHGGSPVADPAATRRSIVAHYCPASRRPRYGGRLPEPEAHGQGRLMSCLDGRA